MEFNTLIFVAAIAFAVFNFSHAEAMSVRAEGPDWFKLLNDNKSWNIVLEGEIDSATPALVEEALKLAGKDGADIFISSPGGSLLAGMQIGRIIRKAGANTHIGTLVPDLSLSFSGKIGVKTLPSQCFSACSLAFIGGVYRYSTKGSQYGVHRFSSKSGPNSSDLETAQIIAAAIAAYIREMDVNPNLFDFMVQESKNSIKVLTDTELRRLNIINNGRKPPDWTIQVVEGAYFLRGIQESIHGRGKASFLCYKGRLHLLSQYDVRTDLARSIAAGGWYHSLLIDDRTIPLEIPVRAIADGIQVFTEFILTQNQSMALAESASMGHAMQVARDAPTFVGYKIDIPASATEKVGTFIRNCSR